MWIRILNDEADKLRTFCASDPTLTWVIKRLDDAEAALASDTVAERRQAAKNEYGSDDVEIDEDAAISKGDHGTWVQGWLWVSDALMEERNAPLDRSET